MTTPGWFKVAVHLYIVAEVDGAKNADAAAEGVRDAVADLGNHFGDIIVTRAERVPDEEPHA